MPKAGFTKKISFATTAGAMAVAGALGGVSPAQAQQTTLFSDEFNSSWDSSKWSVYDSTNFLQRTQFGNQPQMATEGSIGFARFRMDTYNPDSRYSGTYARSTEVLSKTEFTPGNGLEISARLRGQNLPPGLVFAFFTYHGRGTWPNTYYKDEIDFEFLTNFNKNEMWLNIWDDWNPVTFGPNQSSRTAASGLDWSGWHTYKIRWTGTRVDWFVDDVPVRTSTNIVPTDPSTVRFNLWAAADQWPLAYDAALPLTSNPSLNQSYYLDVDWVRVQTLPGAAVGNGTGLAATYYDNKDFTGTTATRVDPTINFTWGYTPPASTIGEDTYSVRWTGQVQAQYSETYTFTTNNDDGMRLWVNGQKLVDSWVNQSPTEYSGQITLLAGQKYDIKLEYYEDTGGAVAQLFWSSQSTPKQIVPQSQLYPTTVSSGNQRPVVTITSPQLDDFYKTAPNFSGTARDPETSITSLVGTLKDLSRRLFWNGSAWVSTAATFPLPHTNGNWSVALPALSDGRYVVRATAQDTQRATTTVSTTFNIDATAPTVAVTTPKANAAYRKLAAIMGTARDSKLSQIYVRLQRASDNLYWNGAAWTSSAVFVNATGLTSWNYALPALADGTYRITPQARDAAGNSTTGTTVSFLIDSALPQVAVTTPRNGAVLSTLPGLGGTASDAQSGIARVEVRLQRLSDNLYWNGSAWATTSTFFPAVGTNNWTRTLPTLSQSTYKLNARAYDGAGNTALSPTVVFTIDSGPSQ